MPARREEKHIIWFELGCPFQRASISLCLSSFFMQHLVFDAGQMYIITLPFEILPTCLGCKTIIHLQFNTTF